MASPRGVADAKFVRHTCSPAPLSTRIRAFRPLDALTANIQYESSLSSWRFASLVLVLLPTLGFLVSPLATVPALASKIRIVCPCFLSVHCCLSCPYYPFPSCLSLAQKSICTDMSGSCAAQGHHRFSVPASTLARKHARLGKTHDLPREPLSGDHGRLLARAPSQSLLGPPAGGPHMRQFCNCATSFTQEASMSPRSRPLAIHLLLSAPRVKDTFHGRCCSISTFALVLFLEHSPRFQSKASGNQGNQR